MQWFFACSPGSTPRKTSFNANKQSPAYTDGVLELTLPKKAAAAAKKLAVH
jgi:HSP20 family molecular chaperone IbpA